jgi:hypothetical protein
MAPGVRRQRPAIRVRHSFQPSRLRDQLLVTAYRLLIAAVRPGSCPDTGAGRRDDRRSSPDGLAARFPEGRRHD